MNKRLHAVFHGQVQGIGFRFTAESLAGQLGISGWVKNLNSGDVEIVAEAGEKSLKEFLSRINDRFSGTISDTSVSWLPATDEFRAFEIRY